MIIRYSFLLRVIFFVIKNIVTIIDRFIIIINNSIKITFKLSILNKSSVSRIRNL